MDNLPHNHDNSGCLFDGNQYRSFYAVNDNEDSQLSRVNRNYHILIITIDRKGRSCVEEFTYFTVINW